MKKKLKKYYHNYLKQKTYHQRKSAEQIVDKALGDLPCKYIDLNGRIIITTCDCFLTDAKHERLLFLINRDLCQYIIQEWIDGMLLTDEIPIYIDVSMELCILCALKKMLGVTDTCDILKILKEKDSIVLLNDCNMFMPIQDFTGLKNSITVDHLLAGKVKGVPKMKVWATSSPSTASYALDKPDIVVDIVDLEVTRHGFYSHYYL